METILYIVLAIAGLFVVMQLYIRLSAVFKKGKVINGVKGKLGKDIQSGRKLLVYFYTNSCAACKPMTPVIDRLKKEFKNIHKINLTTDMDIGRAFGVMGTPATILVEEQKIKSFNLGARTESFLRNLIQ
ncbi:MAG: thioredoxin family protein [Calditrichaceae bacterium]|jgi:thioredoxin 1